MTQRIIYHDCSIIKYVSHPDLTEKNTPNHTHRDAKNKIFYALRLNTGKIELLKKAHHNKTENVSGSV